MSDHDLLETGPDTTGPSPADPAAGSPWWLWAVVLPLVVVVAAGAIRFYDLGEPARCYFDETYYYYDARDYLEQGTERSFAVHPPVGKWLIAAGLVAFGVDEGSPVDRAVVDDPGRCNVPDGEAENPAARAREAEEAFARRSMSALFGTGAVAMAYFAGLRLFRRRSSALLGAALLATDGLALTMSRISMLDVFLQFFVVAAFLAMLVDRDRMWAGTPDHPPRDADGELVGELPDRSRAWLWTTGVLLGLAVATKWSGLAPLGLSWAWILGSELWWRRRWTGRFTAGLPRAIGRGTLALVLVPIAVYLVSYGGWFANVEDTRKADRCAAPPAAIELGGVGPASDVVEPPPLPQDAPAAPCEGLSGALTVLGGWWEEQGEVLTFHRSLEAEHPYRAPATTWPLMTRPVAYYYEACPAEPTEDDDCAVPPGTVAEVLGMGNPAMWWSALLGYPVLLWLAVRRRHWPSMAIAVWLFGQSVPYLLSPRPVFLFYLTPVVPFIALSLAQVADEALETESLRWVPAAIATVSLVGFVAWAPLFLGFEIPRRVWDSLMLLPSWI
jgi:dolichyl-phosphate-mannose-protein mannosyltransferase